jgi:hypothetical protein
VCKKLLARCSTEPEKDPLNREKSFEMSNYFTNRYWFTNRKTSTALKNKDFLDVAQKVLHRKNPVFLRVNTWR